jgi:hypothetical protein
MGLEVPDQIVLPLVFRNGCKRMLADFAAEGIYA